MNQSVVQMYFFAYWNWLGIRLHLPGSSGLGVTIVLATKSWTVLLTCQLWDKLYHVFDAGATRQSQTVKLQHPKQISSAKNKISIQLL